ncbi:NADH-dependent flavin oxidoreductase [Ectobacillus ponti]|uniref:NADH-dependent flavin oxidoreductase n=1 Tax=Ectobacillus ponti TaxID=2961894 RepID=A0AA41X3E8_9BACI|nr:NADH-dependent flavin oxidoreductase [Ectobacillus ponti]MCP8967922.1 NADH-dependent flavin oxidoreductase [Ectobacillus ponti]
MNETFASLFQPFALRSGVELKNRVLMAPMTNFASNEYGTVSEEELAYYKERAGGVGAVITACTYVTRDGKGFHGEFAADTDEFIPSLRQLAETIQGEGAKAILQIFHAGRMAPPEELLDNQPVSASAVAPEREGAVTPRELTAEEVENIVKAFGDATRRAIEAGYDGVEIHGANTYLIQQFFSPHSNRRTDKWGERTAFPLAVVASVKAAVAAHAKGPFVVGYRLSPEERENPGITMEDTLQLVDLLAGQDLDYIHVSTQDFWAGSMRDEDTRSRTLLIQERVGSRIPVIGVGSVHTPEDAVKVLETGVPLVALGRELIMEPKWVQLVQEGRESEIRTTLSKQSKEELVIPNYLWGAIINSPGWFPVVD